MYYQKFSTHFYIFLLATYCLGFESVFKTRKVINRSLLQCLDGNVEGKIYVLDCNTGNFQNWVFNHNLTIQNYATDTSNQWWFTPDNEIRNVATGLCMDARRFEKDLLISTDCDGGNFQKWDEEIHHPVPITTEITKTTVKPSPPTSISTGGGDIVFGDKIANADTEVKQVEINHGVNRNQLPKESTGFSHIVQDSSWGASSRDRPTSLGQMAGNNDILPPLSQGGDIVLGDKIANSHVSMKKVEVNHQADVARAPSRNNNKISGGNVDDAVADAKKEGDAYGIVVLRKR
ncbi:uncharacterized protein LOC110845266 isoform X1 [Folsomia candida]|uniref:uncharacterized protein LOC110845266 isoform X1 n=2 Tax=Folsomia candida TaxID=158441 RepID=UPI001604A721|nr:uncharacterized protein LOC110845266 isoform X1 [Folsomia candida]